MHQYFWAHKPDVHAEHRFCKQCWPDEDDLPSKVEYEEAESTVGGAKEKWDGCVKHIHGPSNMGNHLTAFILSYRQDSEAFLYHIVPADKNIFC